MTSDIIAIIVAYLVCLGSCAIILYVICDIFYNYYNDNKNDDDFQ